MASEKRKGLDLRNWLLIAVGAIVVALALLLFWPASKKQKNPAVGLTVDFVDVGQGDGIVIRCEDAVIVIDGGETEKKNCVASVLKSRDIRVVDCYIATHPHSDHIGAAAYLFNRVDVKNVMLTAFSELNAPTSAPYQRLMDAIEKKSCNLIYACGGDTYDFGSLHLEVFSPLSESSNYNDMSIVLKLTYKSVSFLFPGDAEADAEQQMLASGCDLRADVLKVAHHGGDDATSEAFLSVVAPTYAVISCGLRNEYGHPAEALLARLEANGVSVFRTDKQGTVTFTSDGKQLTVTTEAD